MKRLAVLAAGVVILAALLPAGLAAEPNGKGLFREHVSTCTGAFTYEGPVTLTQGGGMSFWAGGHHLVILSFEYTPLGGQTETYTFGNRTGKAAGDTVTCEGDFPAEGDLPAYHIVSHDVVVP